MIDIISDEEIRTRGCITKTTRCKYLKIISMKDIDGVYRSFYHCISEEVLACGCCKEMEEIK